MTELITLYGVANGASTTLTLQADIAQNTFVYLRIPKGTTLKIWGYRISGPQQTAVAVNYSLNVSTGTPNSPFAIDLPDLASAGSLDLEKRRPILLRSETGKEGVNFVATQSGVTGAVGVSIDCELGSEEEEA